MSTTPATRILVVNDDRDLRDLIAAMLAEIVPEAEVLLAKDGLVGLEHARLAAPQLMLIDDMMPGMLGSELVTRIRSGEVPGLEGVPIVFMTGRSYEGSEDAQRIGADDCLVYPFSYESLQDRTLRLLGR